jgi:hypothetical protein
MRRVVVIGEKWDSLETTLPFEITGGFKQVEEELREATEDEFREKWQNAKWERVRSDERWIRLRKSTRELRNVTREIKAIKRPAQTGIEPEAKLRVSRIVLANLAEEN